jgi:hypothetical protein
LRHDIKSRVLEESYVWNYGLKPPYEIGEHIDVEAFDDWYNQRTQSVQAFIQERKASSEGLRLCLLQRHKNRAHMLPVERNFVRAAKLAGLHIDVIKVRTRRHFLPVTVR